MGKVRDGQIIEGMPAFTQLAQGPYDKEGIDALSHEALARNALSWSLTAQHNEFTCFAGGERGDFMVTPSIRLPFRSGLPPRDSKKN